MVRNPGKADEAASREEIGHDIGKEIEALRADVAALAASLRRYGRLGADEVKDRAETLSDEALAESLRGLGELRARVDGLQSQVTKDVRAHPLAWLGGALGIGLVLGLIFSRRD